ncbi:hypothetical protein [Actinokineospora sp. HUAS TT18]|uniref:hypothetical protein n=1 Tax=Actinokineospora sp. HUAS TT18 TaxID=3447451 RepID=UPI003F51BF04
MAISKYLGSTKNLVGSALGLLGVLLHVFGVVGGVWPVVVVALYLVGALAAPPEKIILANDLASLREGLNTLLGKIRAARVPAEATPHVDALADVLGSLLARDDLDADATHGVTRLVRTDIPLAVETYLNLPWWFAVAKKVNGTSAADELVAQLGLLEADAKGVAGRFFDTDVRKQSDHTRYLKERTQEN